MNSESVRPYRSEVGDSSWDKTMNFKILCLGDSSVGYRKSVCIHDYNSPDETLSKIRGYKPIFGVDFSMKTLYDESGKEIRMQIWNTQGISDSELRVYGKNSQGVIVFWSADNHSMDKALKWRHDTSRAVGGNTPFVLIVHNTIRVKWIGHGLVMNSRQEMDSFSRKHGGLK